MLIKSYLAHLISSVHEKEYLFLKNFDSQSLLKKRTYFLFKTLGNGSKVKFEYIKAKLVKKIE